MTHSRLSLRHIEAFRAVMMSGSMTEAASQIHTSQPQVSRLISQLESITQFPVFERSGSRLTPTQDGSRFFREVEKTFTGLAGLESVAASIRSFSAGRLSVAAMPRLAGNILARIVAQFQKEHPDVTVSIHSGNASTVHHWINSAFCDTGLAMLTGNTPGMQIDPVATLKCVAVLPQDHRLAKFKKLQPSHFEGENFISFSNGSPIRELIDDVFAAAGVKRHTIAEASLGSSICALVRAGLGVSLINPLAARDELAGGGIEVRPFSPSIPVTVALLYPPYQAQTRLVEAFSKFARELVTEELSDLTAHWSFTAETQTSRTAAVEK
jgi:DNA-binding transcriptional LysR family regulator